MYYPSFNIGIEEEYQLIDPATRELLGYVTQSMAQDKMNLNERTPNRRAGRFAASGLIEVGTPVCDDITVARDQLLRIRTNLLELGQRNGFRVAASGTHPFSRWEGREETIAQYRQFAEDTQMIARRILAFGLRIHIGVEDRELAVDVMNTMRYVLPHIFCLSTSSPLLAGAQHGAQELSGGAGGFAAAHRHPGLLCRLSRVPFLRGHAAAHQFHSRRPAHPVRHHAPLPLLHAHHPHLRHDAQRARYAGRDRAGPGRGRLDGGSAPAQPLLAHL